MLDLDARRLAAVDMYGGRGTRFRRRIILIEFVAGTALCAALGVLEATTGPVGTRMLGWWLLGMAANYLPSRCTG